MSWMVLPEWCGETVFILGCGPSLEKTPVEKLRGKGRIIAINDSFIRAPWADVLYFADKPFWTQYQAQIRTMFYGKYLVTLDNQIEGVKTLKNTGEQGLETDPCGLRTGGNSGYQAINLAYHFGVSRIILLGLDMSCAGHKIHWRERGGRPQTVHGYTQTIDHHMLPNFPTLVQPLQEAGVAVVNATPNSRLKVWPYLSLYDVVKNLHNVQFWEGRNSLFKTVSV